jgi:outer membrane protein OmpA-like peptidoglycan-associated protein
LRTADLLADVLKQHPRHRIRIEGFADSQGSEAHNLRLSTRRALAFRDALVQRGVSADRIDTQGLGEAFPVASNRTAEGRQQNRRIEVLFSDESGQLKPRS